MVNIPGFMPRIDAIERYGRSEQSFRRDFYNAIDRNDQKFRSNFKVTFKDGTIKEGTEISRGDIDSWNSEAKGPEWHIAIALLETRYWKKGKGKKKASVNAEPKSVAVPQPKIETEIPVAGDAVVSLLKTQVSDKNAEIEYLRERLTEKEELEKARNLLEEKRSTREEESNKIMRDLGLIIGELKQQGILDSGSKHSTDEGDGSQNKNRSEDRDFVEAKVIQKDKAKADSEKGTVQQTRTPQKPAQPKRNSPIKKRGKSQKKKKSKWLNNPIIEFLSH